MVPEFNPNEWDRDKILEWVMDDGPLTDQQIEFLLYFGRLKKELEKLKMDLKDANASITWWQNRFNAVNRQNAVYHANFNKAINSITILTKPVRQDNSFHRNPIYLAEMNVIKQILKGEKYEEIHKTSDDHI